MVSGLSNHKLMLKVGVHIMLLRIIDPKGGLYNGTQLIVTQLTNHVIEARVITCQLDDDVDDRILIPRIFVSQPDTRFLFRICRK